MKYAEYRLLLEHNEFSFDTQYSKTKYIQATDRQKTN